MKRSLRSVLTAALAVFSLAVSQLPAAEAKWSAPGAEILPRVKDKNLTCPDFSKEPEPKAEIVYSGNVPGIKVNGEVLPPMLYQCHDPHISGAADLVLKLQKCGVKIFEFEVFMEQLINEKGQVNFARLNKDMERLLALNPDAKVILGVRFEGTDKWLKKHPEAAIGYVSGKPDTKKQVARYIGASPASEEFTAEVLRVLDVFAGHIKSQPWQKRVIGFRLSWGVYSEWHYYGMQNEMPDTGIAMNKAFRKFLRERYKTDAALQKAWNNPDVTLDNANVPGAKERSKHKGFFTDPKTEKQLWDYRECHQKVVADLLLAMGKCMKGHFPNRLTGAYYGYVFGMTDPTYGQTLELDRVLGSPYIDFISGPIMYWGYFRHNGAGGRERHIPGVAQRYGKLAIAECDIRSNVALPQHRAYQSVGTSEESRAVFRRTFANTLFNGFGMQLLHVWIKEGERNWFNTPEILTAVYDHINLWQNWFKNPPGSSIVDMAAVYSPWEAVLHSTETKKEGNGIPTSISWMLYTLESSGFAFDLLTPEDFLASRKQYKTVVFLNLFTPSPKLAAQLKKQVRQKGVTHFWVYAPGFVTPNGFSDQAMSNLTGINLKSKRENFLQRIRLNDQRIMQVQEPNLMRQYIRTYAADRNAEVLGRFADDNSPALVRKKLSDGSTAIFSATPIFRTDLMAELLRQSGAHQYLEAQRQGFKINDEYILVHQGFGGVYTVYLPFKVKKAVDCYSGRTLAVNTDIITLIAPKSNTWLLKYEK